MTGRDLVLRSEPGFSLPAFERIAPPPPPDQVAAWIEAASRPGDVVLDLNSRGGWVARSAIDRQRRAIVLESNPLTRLLAEVVLRPPDVRHLDAAFQAIAASPRQQSSLKVSIGELFATRCPRCGRSVVADEFIWEAPADRRAVDDGPRLVRKHYRCPACRDQVGGGDQRHEPVDAADVERAAAVEPRGPAWQALHDRFPVRDGDGTLVDQLLELHSPRQLLGLEAILVRIETDLRAAPVQAALRLALLHALLPASRLNGFPGRVAGVRIVGGRLRPPASSQWRERNPWLAFEDGYRVVRGFIQRLEGSAPGPVQARFGDDIRSLAEGATTAVVRLATPTALRALAAEAGTLRRQSGLPRVRLVLGQAPLRPNQERLSYTYLATCWVLGREAAALLPLEALLGPKSRVPWDWQAASLRRSLAGAEALLGPDSRAILLIESGGGPEALVAAVLGGVGAGYRLLAARLAEPGDEAGSTVELTPPGATRPDGPRTRANVGLPRLPGGAGDPDLVPGRGLFAPPERFDRRPFSAAELARTVTETAVAVLQARGEPARYEQLLGEILVGLDRAGQLRRLVGPDPAEAAGAGGAPEQAADHGEASARGAGRGADHADAAGREPGREPGHEPDGDAEPEPRREGVLAAARRRARLPDASLAAASSAASGDQVETLLGLIRAELTRPDHRRLREIEPGRWWLRSAEDQAAAAVPLADRVEWAVFSLLSTAGGLSEAAFFERIAHLFGGHDLPDEALVRACLESYRSRASTPDALQTGDDLARRSAEHSELIALLADLGHRLGMSVWIGRREQEHRVRGRPLAAWLDAREQRAYLPLIARAPAEELEQVDCIWYVRGRAVLLFEVEWTAILSEPILRRHRRIPAGDQIVRFLVVAPERTGLVRYKLERSPLLRAAFEEANWHILKWNHLRTFAAREAPTLADLEPFLGLDPAADRTGEQLGLFE
ncbi:MAG: hypothetical protein ACOYXS_08990 [Chloroflexota bacterium]